MKFTQAQMERYARHIILPEIGGVGQERLLNSRVLVIGAGGLGSPALMYLAAAGVGRLEVIDFDTVDLTNLQRQILHRTQDIGKAKVDSARETLQALNPDIQVVVHRERLGVENARELIRSVDAVVDGSDNFPTRYLVNDACFFERTPLISGAVFRFEGQLTVYRMAGEGPCLRCLFPEAPPEGLVPSCQEAGIFGAIVGVIGSLQATETIKLLSGAGECLEGTLLLYDALTTAFRRVHVRRHAGCPLCGERPVITDLQLQGQACEGRRPPDQPETRSPR